MTATRHDDEFSELVAARSAQLFRSAVLLTGSTHAAEDLVQTALARTYAAWWRVRRADDPVAYVHGILLKSFLSERRRRSSSEVPVAAVPDTGATARAASGAGHGADPDDTLTLLAALGRLAPLDRAVVVLRYWEDLSVARTAHDLGLSEAAVKNRSLRALRLLREHLTDTRTDIRTDIRTDARTDARRTP